MLISSKFLKILSTPPHHYPFPSLSLIDETCKNRCKKTATGKKEAIDRYVCSPFVREILKESECEPQDKFQE